MNEPNAYWKSLYDEARLSVMIELLGNRVAWQPSYLATELLGNRVTWQPSYLATELLGSYCCLRGLPVVADR